VRDSECELSLDAVSAGSWAVGAAKPAEVSVSMAVAEVLTGSWLQRASMAAVPAVAVPTVAMTPVVQQVAMTPLEIAQANFAAAMAPVAMTPLEIAQAKFAAAMALKPP
jgi:hypothetical protein